MLLSRGLQSSNPFFIEDGKTIVRNDSPLHSLRETLDRCGWSVQKVYEDDLVLMVQIALLSEELEASLEVKLMTPRDCFLLIVDQSEIRKKVLRAAR